MFKSAVIVYLSWINLSIVRFDLWISGVLVWCSPLADLTQWIINLIFAHVPLGFVDLDDLAWNSRAWLCADLILTSNAMLAQ